MAIFVKTIENVSLINYLIDLLNVGKESLYPISFYPAKTNKFKRGKFTNPHSAKYHSSSFREFSLV
jgi:hypothetical protein